MSDVMTQIHKMAHRVESAHLQIESIALSEDRWVEFARAAARVHPINQPNQDPVADMERQLAESFPLKLYWNGLPIIRGASTDIGVIVKEA